MEIALTIRLRRGAAAGWASRPLPGRGRRQLGWLIMAVVLDRPNTQIVGSFNRATTVLANQCRGNRADGSLLATVEPQPLDQGAGQEARA